MLVSSRLRSCAILWTAHSRYGYPSCGARREGRNVGFTTRGGGRAQRLLAGSYRPDQTPLSLGRGEGGGGGRGGGHQGCERGGDTRKEPPEKTLRIALGSRGAEGSPRVDPRGPSALHSGDSNGWPWDALIVGYIRSWGVAKVGMVLRGLSVLKIVSMPRRRGKYSVCRIVAQIRDNFLAKRHHRNAQ